MYGKNESIHLWMLEQERKKSQELTLEQQRTRDSTAQSTDVPDQLLREKQAAGIAEDMPSENDEIEEIDQLLREKASLEEESKRLDEEKKQLILRAKQHLTREIQDVKKENSEKQQHINQLKKRLNDLDSTFCAEKEISFNLS